jgi:hypothetical protein
MVAALASVSAQKGGASIADAMSFTKGKPAPLAEAVTILSTMAILFLPVTELHA